MSRDAIFGDTNRKVLQFFKLHAFVSRGDVAFVSFLALVAVFESVERRNISRVPEVVSAQRRPDGCSLAKEDEGVE
jgi:hypothetical protein